MCRAFDSDFSFSINRVELMTLLDAIGSTYTYETIDTFFRDFDKDPETDSLTYDQVFECIEMKTKSEAKDEEVARKLLEQVDIAGHRTKGFKKKQSVERLIQLRHCPLCKKNLARRTDLDIVSHVALCTLDDPSKLDNFGIFFYFFWMSLQVYAKLFIFLVLGGFLTESYASRKWFTKIINRVTFGSYSSGKNNGRSHFFRHWHTSHSINSQHYLSRSGYGAACRRTNSILHPNRDSSLVPILWGSKYC
jgi:phosphatidylserine decarboxylase